MRGYSLLQDMNLFWHFKLCYKGSQMKTSCMCRRCFDNVAKSACQAVVLAACLIMGICCRLAWANSTSCWLQPERSHSSPSDFCHGWSGDGSGHQSQRPSWASSADICFVGKDIRSSSYWVWSCGWTVISRGAMVFYKQYLEHSVTPVCIKIQGDAMVKAFLHGPTTHTGEGWLIPL